jgi:hypothetical protein
MTKIYKIGGVGRFNSENILHLCTVKSHQSTNTPKTKHQFYTVSALKDDETIPQWH